MGWLGVEAPKSWWLPGVLSALLSAQVDVLSTESFGDRKIKGGVSDGPVPLTERICYLREQTSSAGGQHPCETRE